MHMLQSLFYLTIALHVSGVTITHLREHKTTVTTASGNRYTVLLSAAIVEGALRPQAAHLLRSWVRIPPGAWIFVCCECRVLSGRVLCDELITRPEESYRLWYIVVCDLETSRMYIYDISSVRVNQVYTVFL